MTHHVLTAVTAGVVAAVAVWSCSSTIVGDSSTPPSSSSSSSGRARSTCDFNDHLTVRVRSFTPSPKTDAGTLDAAVEVDAGVDAGADAGLVLGRARTTTVTLTPRTFFATGREVIAGALIEDDAGNTVLDVRRLDSGVAVDVDTTASNAFVLRITSAVPCGAAEPQQAFLDVRLLDDGRVNTVRASIPGESDVPVPVESE